MGWWANTFANLKNMTALNGTIGNFKHDFWKWLLYEMSPSFYIDGPSWAGFFTEAIGWTKHIGIGAAVMLVWMILIQFVSWPVWMGFVLMAAIALIIEIVQFFITEALFVFPLNSLIDIAFYVAGSGLLYWLWNYIAKFFSS